MQHKDILYYFKAMILKKLGKYDEATQLYGSLEKKLRYKEGFELMKKVASIMLLPLTKNKRN